MRTISSFMNVTVDGGWCKDKWGLSWQITPRALTAALADPDRAAAKRAFEAVMQMRRSTSLRSKRPGAADPH